MNLLIIGLIIFFAVHSISIVNDAWRNRMVDRIGEWPWKGLYGVIALVGLVLIVWGYGLARQQPTLLYVPASWLHDLSLLLLIPVFPLLFAAYLPGRIQAVTRHPMLLATMLWALAHLLSNGKLSDVLLFGAFGLWALADRLSLQRRSPHPVPAAPGWRYNDLAVLVLGLAAYLGFVLWLHEWLIGVQVMSGQNLISQNLRS